MKWNGDRLVGEEVIVDNIPGAIFHNGGRIKFGPDKLLYITTGDAQDPSKAQDKNSLAGKILRTTEDGKVVSDNPLGNLIYSYGHRNSQGLAWDMNGKLWVTEHGRSSPTGYDEINLIEKGANYGWDTIQGDESNPTMKTPIRHSGESMAWAPGGAVFVDDSLFFVGLKGEALPLWTANVNPTNSGGMSQSRDHVFMIFFSCLSIIFMTFLRRVGSMWGPFLSERVMGLESGSRKDESDCDERNNDLVHGVLGVKEV
jgi:glucose/arabinose dehydrogenase